MKNAGIIISAIVSTFLIFGCTIDAGSGDSDEQLIIMDKEIDSFSAFLLNAGLAAENGQIYSKAGGKIKMLLPAGTMLAKESDSLFTASQAGIMKDEFKKLTDEEKAALYNKFKNYDGKPVSELADNPEFKKYFNMEGFTGGPVLSAEAGALVNRMTELMAANDKKGLSAFLKSQGLLDLYNTVKRRYGEPGLDDMAHGAVPEGVNMSSGGLGDGHYYVDLLPLNINTLMTGDIFVVSGPNHDDTFGYWSHANMFDGSLLNPADPNHSNCLWSASDTISGLNSWEYATLENGSFKTGVYAEKLGKNLSEYAYARLRPKSNADKGVDAASRAYSKEGQSYQLVGDAKYTNSGWYCSEIVAYSWLPWVRIENNYSWNALDYVWPTDIYDSYRYNVCDWEWVIKWVWFVPVPNYIRVKKSGPTLNLIEEHTQPADAEKLYL